MQLPCLFISSSLWRRVKFVRRFVPAVLLVLLVSCLPSILMAGGAVDRTLDVFKQVTGVTPEQVEASRERISSLDYSNLKVFRLLCTLPDMTGSEAMEQLAGLASDPFTYDHFQLFERFVALDGINLEVALQGLVVIRRLDFSSIWAANTLCAIPSISPAQVLDAIAIISKLRNSGRWAARAFFEIKDQTGKQAIQGLSCIGELSEEQCWAAESSNKIQAITVAEALKNLVLIGRINEIDVWAIRSLFQLPGLTSSEASFWLESYFVKPVDEQDFLYQALPLARKKKLLEAFHKASARVIRRLNALHAISFHNGDEISATELRTASFTELGRLFDRLPHEIRLEYGPWFTSFANKGDQEGVIRILRLATQKARMYLAKQCSAANIYILLSRVTILYDSSFRLILIPELQRRIVADYQGSLVLFLRAVDPENIYVGKFIAALAHKGRLALFFPSDIEGQKEILDLVAGSAFLDENSLICFAAAFTRLAEVVQPAAFHFLLDRMITMARDDNIIFARQIRVILQYYLENDPSLLGKRNAERIREELEAHGTVALESYGETPFAQWREDGVLSGLSIFHGDDDGRTSFLANCRYLSANGYSPRPGRRFLGNQNTAADNKEMTGLLSAVAAGEPSSLNNLFNLLLEKALVVDFVKIVNSIEISHSISVFRDSRSQLRLVAQFLDGGHEMLIHRGHSYWLEDHLLVPLRQLLESGEISRSKLAAKQRFLSIGACGGITIYSELVGFFCNRVDLLGSLGSGRTMINNMYNRLLFETVAVERKNVSWKEMDRSLAFVFQGEAGGDYLLPGGLPAVLYKMIGKGQCRFR